MKKVGIMTALVLALSIAGSAFASTGTATKSVLANSKAATSAKSSAKTKKHKKARKANKAKKAMAPTATPPSK